MRTATFLFALCVVVLLLFVETSAVRQSSIPGPASLQAQVVGSGREVRFGGMASRAEIRVVPVDVAEANHAELASLRSRQAQLEANEHALSTFDPAIREQLRQQDQLIRALLSFAEKQDSDRGKNTVAVEVQRHLNEIEGRTMCEACHRQIVAGATASRAAHSPSARGSN